MDRLDSMEAFVRAVDLGSFAAAAASLDMSAPMVGKHVRALEDRLGVLLLQRSTRRQSLTEVGRAYYERCCVVLAEAAAADALATDTIAEPRGTLRVTAPALLGRYCVAPVLLQLGLQHPGLELELSFSDHFADLESERFDLAVRSFAVWNDDLANRAGYVTRRLARQHMVLCAAPSYLSIHGEPTQLDDLGAHHAIAYSRAGRIRPWLFPREGQSPLEVVPPNRLRLDDLSAIADAAVAGLGLAWLPQWLVSDRIRSSALSVVMSAQPGLAYDSFALWLQTPHLPVKLRLAIDALATGLPGQMQAKPPHAPA